MWASEGEGKKTGFVRSALGVSPTSPEVLSGQRRAQSPLGVLGMAAGGGAVVMYPPCVSPSRCPFAWWCVGVCAERGAL